MRVTAAQYRRNMADYQQWEEQEQERHTQAIAAFKRRERQSGFKLPKWVRILAICAVVSAVVYVIVILALAN